MGTIWFSSNSYGTTDPTVQIQYASAGSAATVITCTTAGTKSISAALPMPAGVLFERVIVCYECSDDTSYIARARLLESTVPGRTVVRFDSPIRLQSTRPLCVPAAIARFTPAGSVTLELLLELTNVAHQISFGGLGIAIADCTTTKNEHVLGEFGPYDDVPKANDTLKKAVEAIRTRGGGVLCIPRDAPAAFFPRNRIPNEPGLDEPAVTIIDYRQGIERTYVPPIGVTNSENSAASGRIIERDVATNLGWQNVFPAVNISSRCVAGASSYSTVLTQPVMAGADRRLYVPTLRGTFKGQVLVVDARTSATLEWVTVDHLGLDATGEYLFVKKLEKDHPAGVGIYNKNEVGGLWINDRSNCDNQSASLTVNRTTYGTGDSFGVTAVLTYQGNINSGGGDEGGVAFAGDMRHDIDCFRGKVASWDATNHVLKYDHETAHLPQKLGTSRPIINLKEDNLIRKGKVKVTGGAITGDTDASGAWSDAVVGRFIAINDPTEYYGNPADPDLTLKVFRWWRITRIVTRDGLKHLSVERALADPGKTGAPTLFLTTNYGKDLPYIIAPGAWVSDVRDGVTGDVYKKPGATEKDPRLIVLAPSPTDGTGDDFAIGDPITNPPGPDVWIPTGFRARHVHNFPGSYKGYSFLSENLGQVQLRAAVAVHGSGDSADINAVRNRMKDRSTEYESALEVHAATDRAIIVRGAVATSAMDLWQEKDVKKIRWLNREAKLAGELHADPDTSNFVFTGKGLDFRGGFGKRKVPVPATAMSVSIPVNEPDNEYSVFVTCSWMTKTLVTNKTLTGFDIQFDTGAPAMGGGTVDWLMVHLST